MPKFVDNPLTGLRLGDRIRVAVRDWITGEYEGCDATVVDSPRDDDTLWVCWDDWGDRKSVV